LSSDATYSSLPSRRYGGSSCVVEDSVVLDLHRMNKIIELNEEYGFAIVEPGVSFVDLYEEIQQNGLNLWPSPPAIGWGSVIGNTLDRGFGYTSNGVHTESQCGMEVVLPNGDLLRTGMGAMADNSTFALYRG
jgi:4-cresol dehydrogenase (hydroxylating)